MILHKYSGSGNDFLIFHSFLHEDRSNLARKVCHRQNGIGADGLIVLLPHAKHFYEWEFYNADGSNAEMCGNASRCVAHYAYKNSLAPAKHSFLTQAGVIEVEVENDLVESNLGKYNILEVFDQKLEKFSGKWYLIDTGVPHLVHFVSDILDLDNPPIPLLKNLREKYNANVNLAYIHDSQKISLLTYERGVEYITLACGTGMGAVFAIAKEFYRGDLSTTLIPPSKEKLVFKMNNGKISFKGHVKFIAVCEFFE